ncbi:MAG: hypothetical protein RID09_07005 [Coleofasciculus sp. G1-WW12-02]|uniref:hypothetical protein n=1 Tax=Coleofasciculus sp. G1-WW12-02 TaxID=3068483 RepID=UPI0032FA578C
MILSDDTIVRFDVESENPLGQKLCEARVLSEEVRVRLGWMGSYALTDKTSINYIAEGATCQVLTPTGYQKGVIKVELTFYPLSPETQEVPSPPTASLRPRPQAQPVEA